MVVPTRLRPTRAPSTSTPATFAPVTGVSLPRTSRASLRNRPACAGPTRSQSTSIAAERATTARCVSRKPQPSSSASRRTSAVPCGRSACATCAATRSFTPTMAGRSSSRRRPAPSSRQATLSALRAAPHAQPASAAWAARRTTHSGCATVSRSTGAIRNRRTSGRAPSASRRRRLTSRTTDAPSSTRRRLILTLAHAGGFCMRMTSCLEVAPLFPGGILLLRCVRPQRRSVEPMHHGGGCWR